MLRRYWSHTVIVLSSLFVATCLYTRYRSAIHTNVFYYNAGYLLTSKTKQFAHTFTFTNTTDTPIHFRSLAKSCQCTTATSDTMVVKPHESARITMSVHLPTVLRQSNLYCTVDTDSLVYPKLQYAIDLFTLPSIAVEPSALSISDSGSDSALDDKSIPASDTAIIVSMFFDSTNTSRRPLRVESPPHLVVKTTELQAPHRIYADVYKTQTRVSVALNSDLPDVPSGITYLLIDAGSGFTTNVPITVQTREGRSIVIPGSLNFGIVDSLQEGVSEPFMIRNEGKLVDIVADSSNIVIKQVATTSTYTTFAATLASLPIEKGGNTAKGIFSGEITVQIDHGKARKLPWRMLIR